MSSYYDQDQDTSTSRSRWVKDTHQARNDAEEVSREIEAGLANIRPYDVPGIVEFYNRLVHQYAAKLRPKKSSLSSLWNETLDTVEIPVGGTEVTAGTADPFGNVDVGNAILQTPHQSRDVSLANLTTWKHENTVEITVVAHDPAQGTIRQSVRKTLFMPPRSADMVVDQLNQCADRLGWLPDAAMQDYDAGEDEVLTVR